MSAWLRVPCPDEHCQASVGVECVTTVDGRVVGAADGVHMLRVGRAHREAKR